MTSRNRSLFCAVPLHTYQSMSLLVTIFSDTQTNKSQFSATELQHSIRWLFSWLQQTSQISCYQRITYPSSIRYSSSATLWSASISYWVYFWLIYSLSSHKDSKIELSKGLNKEKNILRDSSTNLKRKLLESLISKKQSISSPLFWTWITTREKISRHLQELWGSSTQITQKLWLRMMC